MGRPLRLLGAVYNPDLLPATECGFTKLHIDGKKIYLEADAERLETMWRKAVALVDAF